MKITEYNLLNTLAFDSIYQVLSWYDRTSIHLFLNGKIEVITPLAVELTIIISEYNFLAPEMKYGQDRLLYFYWKGNWHLIEEYKKAFPEITRRILKIKK